MKAHKVNEKNIILSIGMIVKNEEKVLERCLKSLQPLMEAITSELIIADTGSEDSTVEIAKKYTDNVYHFEWINDFAAARNSTLERAKGKWYFYLDADEYLDEDIHEIVGFFKIPELYNHYKSAQITLRNYYNNEKTDYTDCMLSRFQNLSLYDRIEDIRFIGSIHETLYTRYPLGYFQTILHHTGYTFNTASQCYNKKERNLKLMREEYKETKQENRHRILMLLIDGVYGYAGHHDEYKQYIKEALELATKYTLNDYSKILYLQALEYYMIFNPEESLKLFDEYYNTFSDAEKYITTVAVKYFNVKALRKLRRFDDAYDKYNEYRKIYNDYKEEKLNIEDLGYHTIYGLTNTEFIDVTVLAIDSLSEVQKYDEAFALVDSINISEVSDKDFRAFITAIKNLCMKCKKYGKLGDYFEIIDKSEDKNRIAVFLEITENAFYSLVLKSDRKVFAEQMLESKMQNHYTQLMKLYISEGENIKDELIGFINSTDDWKNGYTEAVYLAVKNKLDLSNVIDKTFSDDFVDKLYQIAATHDDFPKYVVQYGIPDVYLTTVKRLNWLVKLYECVVFKGYELNDQGKYALYLNFTSLIGIYVSNIYNPELLEDEADVEVLPSLHRFGYYMFRANNHLENGNSIGYVSEMKKALINCESMKEIVKLMLEQFRKNAGL